MLLKSIYCEGLKCKGTLIWPAFLIIPVIPILLGCGNYLANLSLLKSEWYSLWTQITLFYSNFFFAPLIGVYCAFLWRYENFNNCRQYMYTRPIKYSTIFLSKYLMVCLITFMTQIWLCLLFILSGKVISLEGFPPAQMFFWMLRGTIGGFVTATIQFILSSAIKNFAVPIAMGMIGGISGLISANTKFALFWPYSLMLVGMNSNKSDDMVSNPAAFITISVLYIVIFSLIGIYIIKKESR